MVFAALWIELIFLPAPAVLADMELVSIAGTGAQGNGSSNSAAISSGRFVAFNTYSNNLAPGDTNGLLDIFVHDRQTGDTVRVFISSDGEEGNGHSGYPAISRYGKHIVFNSAASNLVHNDTNKDHDIR
jgi:Tol biopolymer transport system component